MLSKAEDYIACRPSKLLLLILDHCASAASECKHLYHIAAAEVQVSVSVDDTVPGKKVVCMCLASWCVYFIREMGRYGRRVHLDLQIGEAAHYLC